MKVNAIQCHKCNAVIYSRATHDFHYCPCKTVAIDGGLEYCRVSFDKGKPPEVFPVILEDKITKEKLYYDWNTRSDILGTIHTKKKLKPKKTYILKKGELIPHD